MAETTLLVGLDGTEQDDKVLNFAKSVARLIGDCTILACYVIEWSPFTFQTAEENERRHSRREEELRIAHERIVDPAVNAVKGEGLTIEGVVHHGQPAEVLDRLAEDRSVALIVVGRATVRSVSEHFFGSVSARLAAASSVPVTIVP